VTANVFNLGKFRSKRRVDEDGVEWIYSTGGKKWVAVSGAVASEPKKKARKPFQTEWVQFPRTWREALRRAKSAGTTYDLALTILAEAFKRKWVGGEVVLSAEMTKMPRRTRKRAIKELAKLELIKLHRERANQAYRVSRRRVGEHSRALLAEAMRMRATNKRSGPWRAKIRSQVREPSELC
jgi:hypothetical protein